MWLHSPDHHTCYLMSGKVRWAWGETFCWLQLDAQFDTPFDAVVWFCAWISQFDIIILVTLCELQSCIFVRSVHLYYIRSHVLMCGFGQYNWTKRSAFHVFIVAHRQYPHVYPAAAVGFGGAAISNFMLLSALPFVLCKSFFFFFEQMEPTKTRFLQNVEDNVASSKIEHLSPF